MAGSHLSSKADAGADPETLPEARRRSSGAAGAWHGRWDEQSPQRAQAKEDNSAIEEAEAQLCAGHICRNLENAGAWLEWL